MAVLEKKRKTSWSLKITKVGREVRRRRKRRKDSVHCSAMIDTTNDC